MPLPPNLPTRPTCQPAQPAQPAQPPLLADMASSTATSTSTGTGLHTHLEGLAAMSPTSPLTSISASSSSSPPPPPPPPSQQQPSPSSRPPSPPSPPSQQQPPQQPQQPPLFSPPAASSIFNNPGATSLSDAAVVGGGVSLSASGSMRLQSFTPRPLSYSGVATRATENGSGVRGAAGVHSSGNSSSNPAVKEVDDPTTPVSSPTFDRAVPNTFSRLFATPTPQSSYATSGRTYSYRGSDSMKLEEFLYTRGFLEGACSDVTILAFGNMYNLHRLILDRSPFFSSCFNGGPWLESTQSEISLSPETSDPNITQQSFEMALARLYGHVDRAEEDRHALPLLAAASFLDLQDLAESCVASLLRNLNTNNISMVVRFVTNSFYGPLTDRLLDSAKALLYRDGWEMCFEDWDGISGEVAAEIVGYDGFYVPSEWLRYCFVKEMIDWRIIHSYSYNHASGNSFGAAREGYGEGDGASAAEEDEADLKPLRDLLENGIYYVHMSFEELQKIGEDRDVLGRRTVSEDIVRDALWQQMILRQRVLNVTLSSPELGITETEMVRQPTPSGKKPIAERPTTPRVGGKMSQSGSDPATPTRNANDGPDTPTTPKGKQSRPKYYIPTEDTTTVIGDCPEQYQHVIVSNQGGPGPKRVARGTDHLGVECTDTAVPIVEELRYSEFPPFRFSAEFRSVKSLKEKKRVYSKTVFYAGSHWNIYIQKVRSSKNVQLGVYLHRAKDRETAGGSSTHNRVGDEVNSPFIIVEEQQRNGNSGSTTAEDMGDVTVTTDGDLTTSTFTSVNITSRPGANTSALRSSLPANADTTNAAVPALGYYVDARPMIQTYFKIFSPSRKGKVLSMFSSGPDSFNFSQSWGWKSSSLILEEGLIGDADKESRLRFMVVLGNV